MKPDTKIVLRYKTGWLIVFALFGLVGAAAVVYYLFFQENTEEDNTLILINGSLWFALAVYLLIFQYGRLKDGTLRRMDAFRQSIKLNELTHAKKISGTYVLEAGKKDMAFNTRMMAKESQQKLDEILAEKGYEFEG
jgi:hypothetical protein